MKKQTSTGSEEEGLSPDRILEVTVDLLRRYGPAKTSVTDVAKALQVTHGSIYRYFASKQELFDTVVERWLHRVSAPLALIASESGPSDERLRRWILGLVRAKRHKVLDDPELFYTYHLIAEKAHGVIGAHVAELFGQLERIIADGIAQGQFRELDPAATARAVFSATAMYHHPYHVAQQGETDPEPAVEQIMDLLLEGLCREKR